MPNGPTTLCPNPIQHLEEEVETWPSHLSKWPHVPEALGQRVVHVDHQDHEGRRARHLFWVSHEPRCQDGARCWAWHGPSVGTPHDGYPSQFAILVDGIVLNELEFHRRCCRLPDDAKNDPCVQNPWAREYRRGAGVERHCTHGYEFESVILTSQCLLNRTNLLDVFCTRPKTNDVLLPSTSLFFFF